jgi:large subunit ribosomal protein L9
MKIILKQDIINLGEEGDIKEVADGYARNYLIPKNMVALYNKQSINELERRQEAIAKNKERKRLEARSFKEKLESDELHFSVSAGEKRRLFGAITSANIVAELAKKAIIVERKKVEIPDQLIKSLGNYTVRIHLYGNEVAELKVVVEANAESKAKEKDSLAKENKESVQSDLSSSTTEE